MTEHSWPDQDTYDPDRIRAAWPATVEALPVAARVTGEVIARQPFGVFIRIDGVPDAVGLAEITALPDGVTLPPIGAKVVAAVIWHAAHNHQVKLRLLADATGPAAASTPARAPDASAADPLVHLEHLFVNFTNGTYQWVDIQRFRLPEALSDDSAALTGLIANARFGNDYATRPGDNPLRHGPYWRDRVTPACYDPIDAAVAERRLRAWAEQFAPLPQHLQPVLEQHVYQPMRAADRVYRLRDLGPAAFHDWGGVHHEFHEFVVIDRAPRTLTLIVAADD